MIVGESRGAREQASRWIEDGQNHYLGAVSRVLQDYDRLQAAVESAERENEQLRGLVYEHEKLRNRLEGGEHGRPHAGHERGDHAAPHSDPVGLPRGSPAVEATIRDEPAASPFERA